VPPDAVRPLVGRTRSELEEAIDRHDADLPALSNFILPTGTPLAAALHVARTVCRRAERRIVKLNASPDAQIPVNAIEYLNRLGDLLFVLARHANHQERVADDPWHPSRP
jgi:cob(I)alamin adenosyltransferase